MLQTSPGEMSGHSSNRIEKLLPVLSMCFQFDFMIQAIPNQFLKGVLVVPLRAGEILGRHDQLLVRFVCRD